MRAVVMVAVLALVGASASLALASTPAGKGKPSSPDAAATETAKSEDKGQPRTGEGCRPRVQVILKGTLVGPPGEAGTSFTMKVNRANAHGRRYVAGTQPVTVTVTAKTIFRRQGERSAGSLVAGDRLLVQARACKADLVSTTGTSTVLPAVLLTAVRVTAHPAQSPDEGSGGAPTPSS